MIVAVIPARFASQRLPGKPLIDLEGQSMIERVWNAAMSARAINHVIVATDDYRIVDEVKRFGGNAVMTDPNLPTGTDRCFAALGMLTRGTWHADPTIVVNIQGDEPLLTGEILDGLVATLVNSQAEVATIVSPFRNHEDIFDDTTVKVVRAADGRALYFSRSAIPFVRGAQHSKWSTTTTYWKHIGVYAYQYQALKQHVLLAPSPLEIAESLEQLRLLQDGAVFQCFETGALLKSVDTPDDAERVREILRLR